MLLVSWWWVREAVAVPGVVEAMVLDFPPALAHRLLHMSRSAREPTARPENFAYQQLPGMPPPALHLQPETGTVAETGDVDQPVVEMAADEAA
jgi:hypothetical protein